VEDVYDRYISVLTPLADRYNLSLDAFGLLPTSVAPAAGHIRLSSTFGEPLQPAPISPTFGTPVWSLLAGTIRSTIMSAQRTDSTVKPAFVGPDLMMGTTGTLSFLYVVKLTLTYASDTHYYWNLTRNIYRYGHLGYTDLYNGAHTINEGKCLR
jgi:Gly-Xaa carboxypeptidase